MTDIQYQTVDGDSIPSRVRDQLAPPDDWGDWDPMCIGRPVGSDGTELYDVQVPDGDGTKRVFMGERGHIYGEYDHYREVHAEPSGHHPYALNPEITHVAGDVMREHITKVCLTTPTGVLKHCSRGGVAWLDGFYLDNGLRWDDIDPELFELVESLADADDEHLPDRPGGWEKLTNFAWHSTHRSSSRSERINDMTSGRAHQQFGWSFPTIVRFGDTRNCCSQPYRIYAPSMHADAVIEALEGTWSVGDGSLKKRHGSATTSTTSSVQ